MESSTKAIFSFVAVFAAGAVFGGFFTLAFGGRFAPPHAAAENGTLRLPDANATPRNGRAPSEGRPLLRSPFAWDPQQLMRRYADRLDLTPEQKEKIEPLVRRAVEDYRRVQRTNLRETNVVIEHLQEDLAKELTPAQREKLSEMQARQRELIKRFEERREQRKALQRENGSAAPESGPPHSRPRVNASAPDR